MTAQGAVSGTPFDPILAHQSSVFNGARLRDLQTFTREFLRRVPADELVARSAEDWTAIAAGLLEFMQERQPGRPRVRVTNPDAGSNGFGSARTIVEVVTDDMPFLVDSVTMALSQADHDVHLVIHPQLVVRRDVAGHLQDVLDDGTEGGADVSAHDVARESWMHLEIDRVPAEDIEATQQHLLKVLSDVREAVEDWPRMHDRVHQILEELQEHPPPLPADELDPRKATLIGDFGREVERNAGVANVIADDLAQDVPVTEIDRFIPNVEAIDAAAVQKAAARLLDPKAASIVVVGDAKQFLPDLRKAYPDLEVIEASALDLDWPSLK